MRRPAAALVFVLGISCTRVGGAPEPVPPANTSPRAVAVYRAIAESIYVSSTSHVVAVVTTSLDSACTDTNCADLASRWGVDRLWWANGDSSEARSSRSDLLRRATSPFDISVVARGRPFLFEARAGDVPPVDADVNDWLRFRTTHADASGAVRISPVGFSESGRTAIAYVDWRCGPTCGHTVGVALTATSDSTWTIAEMLLLTSRGR